jgi:DNA-binding MarR family transcriptional regulator
VTPSKRAVLASFSDQWSPLMPEHRHRGGTIASLVRDGFLERRTRVVSIGRRPGGEFVLYRLARRREGIQRAQVEAPKISAAKARARIVRALSEPRYVGELAKLAGLKRSVVACHLRSLASRGYVEREPGRGNRPGRVSLTEDGRIAVRVSLERRKAADR